MQNQAQSVAYIFTFFAEIKELTNYLSYYSNALLAIRVSIGKKNDEELETSELNSGVENSKVTEEQLTALKQIALNIRHFTTQIYIKFKGLEGTIKEIENEKVFLETLYRKIQKSSFPEFEDVENFCILANKLFAISALGDFIIKNQDYYEQLSGINERTDTQ